MDEFREIKGLHVFTGGTPETQEYDEGVISSIVRNFNELRESAAAKLKPVLKLTHSEDQESIWKKLGVLGSGFVSSLKQEGLKLYADISNVPEMIADALEKGDINSQPSVEIYKDFQDSEGKSYGPALRAVSLLIDEIPRVKGLAGYAAIYEKKVQPEYAGLRAFSEEDGIERYCMSLAGSGGKNPERDETLRAERDSLNAELEAQKAALSAASEKLAEAEKKLAAYAEAEKKAAETARLNEIKKYSERLSGIGVAPVFAEKLTSIKRMITEPVVKFAEVGDALEQFTELLENKKETFWVSEGETAATRHRSIETEYDNRRDVDEDALKLHKQAMALMSEKSLDYDKAIKTILKGE